MIDPRLPLVDLHRHLEGSIRLTTVLDIAGKYGLEIPGGGLSGLQKAVWMNAPSSDILDILPRFNMLRQVLVDENACRRVTIECIEDAFNEGLDYIELRFSPLFMAELHQLDPMKVTAAVCEGWQDVERRYPGRSRLIAILSRTYGPDQCMVELKPALAYAGKGIVGLDLAGDEARWPAHMFIEHFERARTAGLELTAHAGEFAGSNSVLETIDALHPKRIGHAVHAVDDPKAMDMIAKEEITIESCPTSNYYTCSVRNLKSHPLPCFLEHGLKVTLNADDPSLFKGIDVKHEYDIAEKVMGLDAGQIARIQEDGLNGAFLSASEIASIRKQKESIL